MALARITVTIPAAVLKEADRRARALDRSRSWVVAEALRRFVAAEQGPSSPFAPGLGVQRLAQLRADHLLSPEQRVLEAELTFQQSARVAERPQPLLRTRLAQVCAPLNAHGVKYVVVGAQAMLLWGTTRATRDVDILIEATRENAQRLIDALGEVGLGIARELTPDEILERDVMRIGDIPRVDVMTLAWSVRYPEAIRDARTFTVEGVPIPAASIEHLIASKRTDRLQDAADIEVLEQIKRLRAERGEA